MLVHVLVRVDGAVLVELNLDLELSIELAVGEFGVGIDASLGSDEVCVEEIHAIDINGRLFSAINRVIAVHATGGPDGSDERAAHVGSSIVVLPTVYLGHCHNILELHALFSGNLGELWDFLVSSVEALVHTSGVHLPDIVRKHSFGLSKDNWNQLSGHQGWEVVTEGVDPAEEEVVESVRKALDLAEEVSCLLFVVGVSDFLPKRKPDDSHISFSGLLDPLLERSSLDSLHGPELTALRLKDVETIWVPQGGGAVTDVGASSVHDQRVKTIETSNTEEIAGLDSQWVDINLWGSNSRRQFVSH